MLLFILNMVRMYICTQINFLLVRHDLQQFLRACSVSFYVRIFEHNFVDYKEKIRRHTDVW